jgi:hypothetical protein
VNWPQGLLNIFNVGRNQIAALESRYSGPYDRLFNYALTEGSFTFFLTRQITPDETSPSDAVVFVVSMAILNQDQKPVLIVEIKDDTWANLPDGREKADTQMRQRYKQMLHDCPIPRLYGLSLLGTSLRVYYADKDAGDITPHLISHPVGDYILPRDFLEGQWDLDILSQEGLKKMQEIVAYIKLEAAKV